MQLYEKWLEETYEELQEALLACEEESWHHLSESDGPDARVRIYERILTWLAEIERRREWYAQIKRS